MSAAPSQDEDPAQHQGDDDAHHQGLLLQVPGHPEAGHDDHEDEEVVDREAVLGQPAGIELGGVRPVREREQQNAEDQRQADVEADPEAGLLDGRLVRATGDDGEVREQQDGEPYERRDLEPDGELHGLRLYGPCSRPALTRRCPAELSRPRLPPLLRLGSRSPRRPAGRARTGSGRGSRPSSRRAWRG